MSGIVGTSGCVRQRTDVVNGLALNSTMDGDEWGGAAK